MNNKKLLKSIATAAVIIGALAVIIITKPSPAPAVATGSSGVLIADASTYSFGPVPLMGGLVGNIYKVRNTGTEPVTIQSVYTSCMCTTAVIRAEGRTEGPFGMPGHGTRRNINLSLAAGEVAEVEAVFDPAAHGPAGVGPIARSVFIESTAGDPLELAFNAIVTP
ncbi:MAG: DUF1573 domain-containing protein [Candidatus Brennerbacteria bacterium]